MAKNFHFEEQMHLYHENDHNNITLFSGIAKHIMHNKSYFCVSHYIFLKLVTTNFKIISIEFDFSGYASNRLHLKIQPFLFILRLDHIKSRLCRG